MKKLQPQNGPQSCQPDTYESSFILGKSKGMMCNPKGCSLHPKP